MKTLRICSFALVIVLGIVLLSGPIAVAQQSDPESVYRAAYDAFNEGDVDAAMALFADDVVGVLLPPPPGVDVVLAGIEPFRMNMEDAVSTNMQWALDNFHVNGEAVSYTVSVEADDFLADLGVYPIEFTGFSVVRDGLILAEVWSMTEDSRSKIDEAMALEADQDLAHLYLQKMWDEGDMDVAQEILAEGFVDHNPRPGNDADKAGIMADAAGFHEAGMKNRIDDLIVTEDLIVLQVTVGEPADDGEVKEGLEAVILLGVEDGQITDRRIALFGWE